MNAVGDVVLILSNERYCNLCLSLLTPMCARSAVCTGTRYSDCYSNISINPSENYAAFSGDAHNGNPFSSTRVESLASKYIFSHSARLELNVWLQNLSIHIQLESS